jgi:transposase
MAKITFMKETVKELEQRLGQAYQAGDLRRVRRLAVLLGIARKTCLADLLRAWKINRQTAYNWLASFVERRWDSLLYQKSAGRPARLTKSQKQELYSVIQAGPEAAGYDCGCWTTLLIQEWIDQHFGVLYNRFYVAELLHHLGLSYQKAHFVSGHLDEKARQDWMATQWPAILAKAHQEGWRIFFEDEVSFAQWGSLAYTWAPKGHQPAVKTSGIRKGYKVFGLIDYVNGQFYYQDSEDRFNSLTYRCFLYCLLTTVADKIILIHDGATYHTSQDTQAFIEEYRDRLLVYQLPAYSPDYNPIEHLWKKVKTKATHNRYFANFAQLVDAVEGALAYFDARAGEILSLMGVYSKPATSQAIAG